jgi:D-aspartate ligase
MPLATGRPLGYRSAATAVDVQQQGDGARTSAVVVGGTGPGTLGLVRSLSHADIPIILLDANRLAPAMLSRYGRKVVGRAASGLRLVEELLTLADTIPDRAVLFLNSDDAVLTVSQHRAEYGFAVPRSVTVREVADLKNLGSLRFPSVVKPSRSSNPDYTRGLFARGYKVTSFREAEDVCRRILPTLPDIVVQEWIEGPDSDLYFCLQYVGANGLTVSSFTGRKLGIWPPDVGLTTSCTVARDAEAILQPLTEAFFRRVSFTGMGAIEFKKDAHTGEFIMVEPTVGRIDGQEEVATLHGVNIPLAAYLYETGQPVPAPREDLPAVIWKAPVLHWGSHRTRTGLTVGPNIRVYDAYWRANDPFPILSHLLHEALYALQRRVRRVPFLHRLARALKRTVALP